jgi:hypothetical protein
MHWSPKHRPLFAAVGLRLSRKDSAAVQTCRNEACQRLDLDAPPGELHLGANLQVRVTAKEASPSPQRHFFLVHRV